jgi:hypothetical protein
MPRGTLVVDEKLLRDNFLRQQRGGNMDTGSEVFSKALRDMLFLYSNKVLKLLAKEYYKQPQKLVKMYSKGKM